MFDEGERKRERLVAGEEKEGKTKEKHFSLFFLCIHSVQGHLSHFGVEVKCMFATEGGSPIRALKRVF